MDSLPKDLLDNLQIYFMGKGQTRQQYMQIESLLALVPEVKDNIIFIGDGEITPELEEYILSKDIELIKFEPSDLTDYKNSRFYTGSYTSYEHCVLLNKVFKYNSKKYVIINDIDIIFINGDEIRQNLLELYYNKCDAICPRDIIKTTKNNYLELMRYNMDKDFFYVKRFQPYHSYLNFDFLKQHPEELLTVFETTTYDTFVTDTGYNFYCRLEWQKQRIKEILPIEDFPDMLHNYGFFFHFSGYGRVETSFDPEKSRIPEILGYEMLFKQYENQNKITLPVEVKKIFDIQFQHKEESISEKLKRNVTIQFTSRDIKPFLQLQIYSFLTFYPDLKDNIVVFDDDSTDGTREWLESENINIIGWDCYKERINTLLDVEKSGTLHKSCVSHSFMIKELMRQITTKYLFVIDQDLITLSPGWLEKFYNKQEKTGQVSIMNNRTYSTKLFTDNWENGLTDDEIEYYSQFKELLIDEGKTKDNDLNNIIKSADLSFTLFNLQKIRENELFFDDDDIQFYKKIGVGYVDTGISFLLRQKKQGLIILDTDDIINLSDYYYKQDEYFHFSQIQTQQRISTIESYSKILSGVKELYLSHTTDEERNFIKDIVEKYKIDFTKFGVDFDNLMRNDFSSINQLKLLNSKFEVIDTEFKDLKIIIQKPFHDHRGYFSEQYNKLEFENLGINIDFVQDCESLSYRWTIRGMHLQYPLHPQWKLVRCTQGKIYDVVVDLRTDSDTFMKYYGIILEPDYNYKYILVPPGFAHGFLQLGEINKVLYKVSDFQSKENEKQMHYLDSEVNIDWKFEEFGVNPDKIIISQKDKNQNLRSWF